ncbi:hypothetical protein [Halorubrum sp. PV6]|uniref:hypothetical protein n=1 Tax=Halorubrum sp. PV6 TaxID=634157 RepID=UPI000F859C95|nr:hypothetical protein [Halorubrum sp. PV6]AZQ14420.1 hypothetical protein DOS48_06055 [Halorubrum sp. PV6]
MRPRRSPSQFVADASAVVRSDERMILLFLVLLAIAATAVFVYYTVALLDALPQVPPSVPGS